MKIEKKVTDTKNRTIRILLIILLIGFGLFIRLWNYHSLFYFAIDEEKAAYIISGIANATHFPTVGHPSSIGFRLGPLEYYLLAPFWRLGTGAPIVWGYVGIGISVFSMILIYKVGSKINVRVGMLSLFLYSISYLNALYDRRGWQLTFHSALSLLILLFLYKLKKNSQARFLYLLTFLLICCTQFEVATIIFVPFVILSVFIFGIKIPKKHGIMCAILFIMSFSPLLVFDLRHDFLNARYLINYFIPDAGIRIVKNKPLQNERSVYLAHNLIPSTFSRLITAGNEKNVAIQYANCPQYLSYKQNEISLPVRILTLGIFAGFCIMVFKLRNKDSQKYLMPKLIFLYFTLLFSSTALYTYFFHGEMAEYYMQTGFAYFFIITSYVLVKIIKSPLKLGSVLFLIYFLTENSASVIHSFNPYGYTYKIEAEKWVISHIGGAPFTLESPQTCWYSGGFRYLFSYLKNPPLTSYMDQYLNEYYPIDTNTKPAYRVTLLTPELIGVNPPEYEEVKEKLPLENTVSRKFGDITVYVERLSPVN